MKNLLLPHRFQKPALVLLAVFSVLLVLCLQYDFEVSFLAMPHNPKAIFSNDNFTDEALLIGFLLSLAAYGFSREKEEDEYSILMRFRAMALAVIVHTLFSIALICFVFGWQFPVLAAFHLFTVLLLYVLFYKSQRFWARLRTLRS